MKPRDTSLSLGTFEMTIGRYVPVRFIILGLMEALGGWAHLLTMSLLLVGFGVPFFTAQAIGTVAATIATYSFLHFLTHAEGTSISGSWRTGLMPYVLICSVGALAGLGLADLLFRQRVPWPMAALAGIAVRAAWNYGVLVRPACRDPRR